MKTKLFFYGILLFIGLSATAQQAPFMVCNPAGTTCTPYNDLTSAYTAATAGDFIYLPAGNFSLGVNITKQVHFIGAGFDPNGSITTGITSIAGNLVLSTGASGSTFEGFYLSGNSVAAQKTESADEAVDAERSDGRFWRVEKQGG